MSSCFAIIKADIKRNYELQQGNRFKKLIACLLTPGVQTVIVFRFGQWLHPRPLLLRLLLEPIYQILNGLVQVLWGIELPRSTKIGAGLYIGHFGGITISGHAVIGCNCNLSQNITIGVAGDGDKAGVPVIGDNVYIAPGARIFGRITIGNNVKIGANAVVYKDIPDNAIVVLDPGFKIISYKGNRRLDTTP